MTLTQGPSFHPTVVGTCGGLKGYHRRFGSWVIVSWPLFCVGDDRFGPGGLPQTEATYCALYGVPLQSLAL